MSEFLIQDHPDETIKDQADGGEDRHDNKRVSILIIQCEEYNF